MPRPPRIHLTGALYHVTSKAASGALLFKDAEDYETYLELLQQVRQQFGVKVFAYVLLPDSLHLCLEPVHDTTLSDIMHALNSHYTKLYVKRYGSTSHLFDRFKSTIAEKAPSLLRLTGYLHTLPIRSGVAGDLRAYRWSSYPTYLVAGLSNELDLRGEVQEVLDVLAHQHPGLTYEQYLHGVPTQEWETICSALRHWVFGSEAFVNDVKQRRPAIVASQVEPTRPAPTPQPGRPRLVVSPALTASMAVALSSLAAAGLYATNMASMKQTLAALGRERSLSSLYVQNAQTLPQESNPAATAQLATFIQPSRLNGTSWDVQVHTMTGIPQPDRIEFRNGKVVSQQLSTQGFLPSNYTLSVGPNGVVVWETMQTAPSGEVVCWRGEWEGSRMQGVMTRQLPGAAQSNFSFVGISQLQPEPAHQTSET